MLLRAGHAVSVAPASLHTPYVLQAKGAQEEGRGRSSTLARAAPDGAAAAERRPHESCGIASRGLNGVWRDGRGVGRGVPRLKRTCKPAQQVASGVG